MLRLLKHIPKFNLNQALLKRHFCSKPLPPVFAELKKASLLCDTTADISELPNNCSVYVGFDPTADSLHIGNLLMIMVLQRLANHGYRPIALVLISGWFQLH